MLLTPGDLSLYSIHNLVYIWFLQNDYETSIYRTSKKVMLKTNGHKVAIEYLFLLPCGFSTVGQIYIKIWEFIDWHFTVTLRTQIRQYLPMVLTAIGGNE